jgi:hypothetical protein
VPKFHVSGVFKLVYSKFDAEEISSFVAQLPEPAPYAMQVNGYQWRWYWYDRSIWSNSACINLA